MVLPPESDPSGTQSKFVCEFKTPNRIAVERPRTVLLHPPNVKSGAALISRFQRPLQ